MGNLGLVVGCTDWCFVFTAWPVGKYDTFQTCLATPHFKFGQ